MATRDPTTSDYGRADQSEGNEAVNERRRLKAIHDAREAVKDQRRRADEALFRGEIGRQTARTALRRAVTEYVMDVETLMKAATPDDDGADEDAVVETDYWNDYEIASWELPDGDQQTITGMAEFMRLPDPIRVEVEQTEERTFRGQTTQTQVVEQQIPRHVLREVYRTVNQFLYDVGLDLEVSDGVEEYYFDLSDVEGAEWDMSDIKEDDSDASA